MYSTYNEYENNQLYINLVKNLELNITPQTRAEILQQLTLMNNRLLANTRQEQVSYNKELQNATVFHRDNYVDIAYAQQKRQNDLQPNELRVLYNRPQPSCVKDRALKNEKNLNNYNQFKTYSPNIESHNNFDVDEMLNELMLNQKESKLDAELDKLNMLKMELISKKKKKN